MSGQRALAACAAAVVAVIPAFAGDGHAGYEDHASAIASRIVGHRVSIVCADAGAWRQQARSAAFDPAETWALTPFRWDPATRTAVPTDESMFSPSACRYGSLFARRPTERGARLCEYRQTAGGRLSVPVWAECGDWESKLLAVHVLTHESVHLAGERDEGVADCLAVQVDAYVAVRLGASDGFARSLAQELWQGYLRLPPAAAAECRDEGNLDLFRGFSGWPTPKRPLSGDAVRAALAARVPVSRRP